MDRQACMEEGQQPRQTALASFPCRFGPKTAWERGKDCMGLEKRLSGLACVPAAIDAATACCLSGHGNDRCSGSSAIMKPLVQ